MKQVPMPEPDESQSLPQGSFISASTISCTSTPSFYGHSGRMRNLDRVLVQELA